MQNENYVNGVMTSMYILTFDLYPEGVVGLWDFDAMLGSIYIREKSL